MPPKPVQVSLSAETQADAAVGWYIGEGALTAAEDFTDELDRALRLLNQFAAWGESGAHNTRSQPLHGFPYSLIYRLRGNTVRVIAVVHHSRRPGYRVGRR